MGMYAKFKILADNLRNLYGTTNKLTIEQMVMLTNTDPLTVPVFQRTEIFNKSNLGAWRNYTGDLITFPSHPNIAVTVTITMSTTNSGPTSWYAYLQDANGNKTSNSSLYNYPNRGIGTGTVTIDIPATDTNTYTKLVVSGSRGSSLVSSIQAMVDVT